MIILLITILYKIYFYKIIQMLKKICHIIEIIKLNFNLGMHN